MLEVEEMEHGNSMEERETDIHFAESKQSTSYMEQKRGKKMSLKAAKINSQELLFAIEKKQMKKIMKIFQKKF